MPAVLPPPEPAILEPEATQPSSIIELEPTQPSEIIPSGVSAAGAAALGDAATELLRQPEEGGALDELFGTDSFQEYNEPLIPAATRSSRRAVGAGAGAGAGAGGGPGGGPGGDLPGDGAGDGATAAAPRAPLTRTQKTLLWVAGALVAVLALIAIFALGTRIPTVLGPAPGAEPSPSATPSATPSPLPTERPIGPVAPGDYAWDEVWGGECLEPYVDAWQEEYTVVDCAEPHGGQLVRRAALPLPEGALEQGPFPGEEALAAQMGLLCSAPGVLDLVAAGAFNDVQVQGSFPATEEQWQAGEQDYFCFVSRSSGELLTGSLAPPPPPAG